ncbi:MAG: hypothetical protein ACF8MF_12635 [Phycisphaerales bacterium JB052]
MANNDLSLPTEEEIAKLPKWAKLAFAARCARRVLPLYQFHTPEASKDDLDHLDYMVGLHEGFAANASFTLSSDHKHVPGDASGISVNAANSMAAGVAGVIDELRDIRSPLEHDELDAKSVIYHLVKRSARSTNSETHLQQIRADLKLLELLSLQEKWTDDTPVPPEVFGPMWPEGVPERWPEEDSQYEQNGSEVLEFAFALPPMPNCSEVRDALRTRIREVLMKANAVHLAEGGSGLEIKEALVFSEEGVLVEDPR